MQYKYKHQTYEHLSSTMRKDVVEDHDEYETATPQNLRVWGLFF